MPLRSVLVAAALLALALPSLALGTPPAQIAIGGQQGTLYVAHRSGDTFEPTEDLALDFDRPVVPDSVHAALSIDPPTPWKIYPREYGKRILVTFRKTPATMYTVRLAPGIRALDGTPATQGWTVDVRTAPVVIPKPLRKTPGDPYRYGTLAHPFPKSLGGPDADRMIEAFVRAGVHFVRIDYCGTQIEPQRGSFDWTLTDRIAEKLAARGITELPIVEQYCAPKWSTGGFGYPAIWGTPDDYAAFAGAIAQHVAQRFPRITRLELFNEPNLHGWWSAKNPAYAATDGSATALYMRAAYAAVKRSGGQLTVVGPALADGGRMIDPRKFLATMYDTGCRRGACWDVLSTHNYRWQNPTFPVDPSAPNRFDIYQTLVALAAQRGDPQTHVMLTEWGFSTREDSPDGLDPQVQAEYLALGFNRMLAEPLVDGIVYVNLYNPDDDFWGATALMTRDFREKPAFAVYREFADP
jgi:hypothetical protein